jgi:hypothetical protein
MSADSRLTACIEAALCRRFDATSADVSVAHCGGTWRAWAHIYRADGSLSVSPTTRHARKRDAVRSVATLAGLRDEDFAEPPAAPEREAVDTQMALEIEGSDR